MDRFGLEHFLPTAKRVEVLARLAPRATPADGPVARRQLLERHAVRGRKAADATAVALHPHLGRHPPRAPRRPGVSDDQIDQMLVRNPPRDIRGPRAGRRVALRLIPPLRPSGACSPRVIRGVPHQRVCYGRPRSGSLDGAPHARGAPRKPDAQEETMDRSSPVETFRRRAAVAVVLGCLLLLGSAPVAADEDEKPDNVVAFPNSPGMITLTWTHSGEDVYWFVLEQESPAAVAQVDRDKRVWSVPDLEPSRTYRYRVCAVFAFRRKCSDEDGAGLASVTTLPRPPSGGGGSAGGAAAAVAPPPVAKPLYSPMIRAMPVRLDPGRCRWCSSDGSTRWTASSSRS